jgi:hypothetical protein
LQGFDYSDEGGFFITIVSFRREYLFGELVGGEIKENCLVLIIAPGTRFYTDHPEGIVKLDLHCLVGPSLFHENVLSLAIQ